MYHDKCDSITTLKYDC